MMKTLKTAALALALATPGTAMAAGDGDLGVTSSESMIVSATATPITDDYVQILGLEDVTLPDFPAGSSGLLGGNVQYICLNKNTPGPVTLTVDKPDMESGAFLPSEEYYVNRLISNANTIEFAIALEDPNTFRLDTNGLNSWTDLPATSPSNCSASSGFGVAFAFYSILYSPSPVVEGTYSNTFTLTLSAG